MCRMCVDILVSRLSTQTFESEWDGAGESSSSRISIFEIDAIPWQNPSRPIPNFLLANLIKKIGKIASYHCKNQPLSIEKTNHYLLKSDM